MKKVDIARVSLEDRIQKTWIPEGTLEYKTFKHVTQENKFLANLLKQKFVLKPGDLVLDVGGREGDISLTIQDSQFVHIIDPDPTISPLAGKFLNKKIQHADLSNFKYNLIICSHVLGYLGNQNIQEGVVMRLIDLLDKGGTLVLFYNTNVGYMRELLDFSKQNLTKGHYDYFDEEILNSYKNSQYFITSQEVSFVLDYSTYEDLAHCCWFLFGAMDQDIEGVANKFLPKLRHDLSKPSFPIDERVTFVRRNF